MRTSVCVTIITYNSREFIEACVRSVFGQKYGAFEVVIVDNASTDGTREMLSRLEQSSFEKPLRVIYNNSNLGFAHAQNQAIFASASDWVLALNPDVVLQPDFVEQLLAGSSLDATVGTVCGLLMSIGRDLRPPQESVIDTAGIYFTPEMRHFDRGWHQRDYGRYQHPEYVFGASGAAALYRRDMISDVSEGQDFFDPDFFFYREDADVAWRAQLLGWRCLYVPGAVGYHVRSVGPHNRRGVPAAINMHSVKNRFLMRIKNMTGDLYRRCWLETTTRDLLVFGGCLFWEPASLPAFWHVAKCFRKALKRRRWIMSRRRVSDEYLARWFASEPCSQRLTPESCSPPRLETPLVATTRRSVR